MKKAKSDCPACNAGLQVIRKVQTKITDADGKEVGFMFLLEAEIDESVRKAKRRRS